MKRSIARYLILALLVAPGSALGAEQPAKTGTIKGTITFGGMPTADAVVSVEGVMPAPAARKPKTAVMDQRDIKFVPRVLSVIAGTTVDFPNNDQTWHNVYSASDAKPFDLGLYPPKKARSVTFDKAAVVRVLCNVHPTMEAFIVVKGHPFFSATDERGNYRINGVPLGSYRLAAWHPEVGTVEVTVELVREGQVLDINFDLKRK